MDELKAGQTVHVHGVVERIKDDGTVLVRVTGKWQDQFVLVDRTALLPTASPQTSGGVTPASQADESPSDFVLGRKLGAARKETP
jgi:hypothetical protein